MSWFKKIAEAIRGNEDFSDIKSSTVRDVINGNIFTKKFFKKGLPLSRSSSLQRGGLHRKNIRQSKDILHQQARCYVLLFMLFDGHKLCACPAYVRRVWSGMSGVSFLLLRTSSGVPNDKIRQVCVMPQLSSWGITQFRGGSCPCIL